MKNLWLIEKDIFDANLDYIFKALLDQKCGVTMFPFNGKDFNFQAEEPMFVYGSCELIQYLYHNPQPNLYPLCNLPAYRCQEYYKHFKKYLVQNSFTFIELGKIERNKTWLMDQFGVAGQIFIRPDVAWKPFSGNLVSIETWVQDFVSIEFYEPEQETLCVVSRPKHLFEEWRFIVGQPELDAPYRILGHSQYKLDGKKLEPKHQDTPIPPEVIEYVEHVLHTVNYQPDPVYIMDVANTLNGPKVLEISPIAFSDLYRCKMDELARYIGWYTLSAHAMKDSVNDSAKRVDTFKPKLRRAVVKTPATKAQQKNKPTKEDLNKIIAATREQIEAKKLIENKEPNATVKKDIKDSSDVTIIPIWTKKFDSPSRKFLEGACPPQGLLLTVHMEAGNHSEALNRIDFKIVTNGAANEFINRAKFLEARGEIEKATEERRRAGVAVRAGWDENGKHIDMVHLVQTYGNTLGATFCGTITNINQAIKLANLRCVKSIQLSNFM